MLDSLDPGDDVPVEWIIDWGDGSTATRVAGDVSSASHDYAVGGNYVIRATLGNDDGSCEAVPLAVSVADRPLLQVTEGKNGGAAGRERGSHDGERSVASGT